ncbi:hypothetical protein, partial [Bacillus sp. mrc49]|uniref:hypothetical protein n=1 Tax=Bacillus sp. mrc49 TaxID=2054913 RepID=UPI0012FE389F
MAELTILTATPTPFKLPFNTFSAPLANPVMIGPIFFSALAAPFDTWPIIESFPVVLSPLPLNKLKRLIILVTDPANKPKLKTTGTAAAPIRPII